MWGAVMSKIHTGLEPKEFNVSSYAVDRYYCTETGNLATDACPSKAIGWYKKNNVPDVCTSHEGTALDIPAVEAEKAESAENTENTETTSSADTAE